jgi:uncharacterized protein YjlB
MQAHPAVKQQEFVEPEEFPFKDDGIFPNSALPLLLYRQAFTAEAEDPASVIEQRFAENDWTNSWRNGVYSFAHYHSTTHEALGVYRGSATLRLGGEHGKNVEVHAGDVIVIPTGVAHRKVESSEDFGVVGAYPDGREWDLRPRRSTATDLESGRLKVVRLLGERLILPLSFAKVEASIRILHVLSVRVRTALRTA